MRRASRSGLALAVGLLLFSLAPPGCALELDPGIAVELYVRGGPARASRVRTAWVHVAEASLVPCPSSPTALGGRGARETLASLVGPARARAHGPLELSALMSIPQVVLLHEGGASRQGLLGTVGPPPGSFCAVRVQLTPASRASMAYVAEAEGCALRAESAEREDDVCAQGEAVLEVLLGDIFGAPQPLVLDAASELAVVQIDLDVEAAWASCAEEPGAGCGERMLSYLVERASARVLPP